jgi:hypothetical protein
LFGIDLPHAMNLVRRALVLACLASAVAPSAGYAGTYDVHGCRTPDRRAAPTDGWQAETGYGAPAPSQTCSSGIPAVPGALFAHLQGDTYKGASAGWVFTAPRDTRITAYTLWRSVRTAGTPQGGWYHDYALYHDASSGFDSRNLVDFCTPFTGCTGRGGGPDPLGVANRTQQSELDIARITLHLQCDASVPKCGPTQAGYGRLRLFASRIRLEDLRPPQFTQSPVGSLLAADAPLEGEKILTFAARDAGAGVEKIGIVVDGRSRLTRPGDPYATRCVRPFTATVPCPRAADAALAFDTAILTNGPHAIQASVTDAAGNETRSDPVVVTTRNGSRPNGQGASRFVRLSAWLRSRRTKRRASAVVPYGSVRRVDGRLTAADGKPIAGAVLDVVSRVDRPGAKDKRAGAVTTRADGRFSYRVRRGPSRDLRFEYKAYTLDPAPVSSARVTLGVRAGFRLRLSPRRVRNGQRVVFRGRLKGGPARKGTRVTIDVLVPDARRRVPIGNVKADAKGRFRFTYRFRRTLVQARYRFQARLVAQPGYPYRGATSRRVSVVVSP